MDAPCQLDSLFKANSLFRARQRPKITSVPTGRFVPFDGAAEALMNDWRQACSEWETDAAGLMVSFIGKLPGMRASNASAKPSAADGQLRGTSQPRNILKAGFRAFRFAASLTDGVLWG